MPEEKKPSTRVEGILVRERTASGPWDQAFWAGSLPSIQGPASFM
jgi:hypothetical protein